MDKVQLRMDPRRVQVVITALDCLERHPPAPELAVEAREARIWLNYLLSRYRQRKAATAA